MLVRAHFPPRFSRKPSHPPQIFQRSLHSPQQFARPVREKLTRSPSSEQQKMTFYSYQTNLPSPAECSRRGRRHPGLVDPVAALDWRIPFRHPWMMR